MQKKLYIFIGALILIVLFLGFASAESCDIMERSSCDGNIVLGLSDSTNAHGEFPDVETYSYVLCCDFEGTPDCGEDGTNKIIALSDVMNAHAEIPSLDNYETDVCYGDLECRSTTGNCESYEMGILSLTDNTNAHIGGFDDYDVKICCRDRSVIIYDYEIELQKGWNLISIPLVPESTTTEAVLGYANVSRVYAYDLLNPNADNGWLLFIDGVGSLETMTAGYGYWVYADSETVIQGNGELISEGPVIPPSRTLVKGWNLIGHYGLEEKLIDEALYSLINKVSGLPTWTSIWPSPLDQIMRPGQGYWLGIDGSLTFYMPKI